MLNSSYGCGYCDECAACGSNHAQTIDELTDELAKAKNDLHKYKQRVIELEQKLMAAEGKK